MSKYKCLNNNFFQEGNYKIVPIRFEDKDLIMNWRNDQMFHLRQKKLLSIDDQNKYFNQVVNRLFDQKHPEQILFSFLENDKCIGYGGLVHIDWKKKTTELSFIMNSSLEKDYFNKNWEIFLKLIQELAFNELNFYKMYTYAFDIRPKLYKSLLLEGFSFESRIENQYLYEGKLRDVVIHSKLNKNAKI